MTKQKETEWESETRTAAAPRRPCLGLLHSWPDPFHAASAAQRRAPDTHTDPIVGGEGGIRTLGDLRHTRFPSVRLRPLGHLSEDPRTGRRLPYPVDGKGGKERAPKRSIKERWRRGRDLNPRWPFNHTGFRNQPIQPLWHLSVWPRMVPLLAQDAKVGNGHCWNRQTGRQRALGLGWTALLPSLLTSLLLKKGTQHGCR
jgi:hypothetical protein